MARFFNRQLFSHLRPRWRKVLRDLWVNKTRTVLVVLSIAVGVFAVGTVVNTRTILLRELATGMTEVKPASALLTTNLPFDDDLVETVRRMSEVAEAEGRYRVSLRMRIKSGEAGESTQWVPLEVVALDDFNDIRINRLVPESGAWPPPRHTLLLERSYIRLAGTEGVQEGSTVIVETMDGTEREMQVSGLAYEFNQDPSGASGTVYGYVTLDTLEWLGEPRGYNEMSFVVAENKLDEAHIRAVVPLVEDKIEKSGRLVDRIEVPTPGEHPLEEVVSVLLMMLGSLGFLSLIASGFLVINTISAILTEQVRQIGVMKAVGARPNQIMQMYLGLALIFGLLALLIAIPLGVGGAYAFSTFIAGQVNLSLTQLEVPPAVLAMEVAVGLLVPVLAAIYPILLGTRITVREAISSYGLGRGKFGTGRPDRLLQRLRGVNRPLLLSLRNTFRRRVRLVLILLTLILSGSLFIGVLNTRASLYRTLDEAWLDRNYDLWVTMRRPYRMQRLERAVRQVPGVVDVESFGFSPVIRRQYADGSEGDYFSVVALSPTTALFKAPILEGRWLLPEDRNAVVINTDLLDEEPDLKVGDTLVLKIEGRETPWQLVGIAEEVMAPPFAYVNYDYFTRVVREVGRTRGLWVTTGQHDFDSQADVAGILEDRFRATNLRIRSLDTLGEQRLFMEFHFDILTGFFMVMALILAAVGGLGLTGTMSINVLERMREFGVMRAIGASDRAVKHLVITEGIVIGLLSWLIAVGVGFPTGNLLSNAVGKGFLEMPLIYSVAPSGILLWLGIVIVLSAAASLIPAQMASRLTVREVLAYE